MQGEVQLTQSIQEGEHRSIDDRVLLILIVIVIETVAASRGGARKPSKLGAEGFEPPTISL